MPTYPTDRPAGFTLLELLAVLAVLGFAAAAVLQLGQGSAEAAKVRSFLIHAEAMMRQARIAAIETMAEQDVVIDTKARRIIHEARGIALDVPDGVSLDGDLAHAPEAEENRFVIRFFPSGGSTGAKLPFLFRGETYELRVNWLTGHADVRRG
jgi:general secretion pathway protein H